MLSHTDLSPSLNTTRSAAVALAMMHCEWLGRVQPGVTVRTDDYQYPHHQVTYCTSYFHPPSPYLDFSNFSLDYALGLPHYVDERDNLCRIPRSSTLILQISVKNPLKLFRPISDSIWTEIIVVSPFRVRALRLPSTVDDFSKPEHAFSHNMPVVTVVVSVKKRASSGPAVP